MVRLEAEDALTSSLSTSHSNKPQQQHSISQLNETSLKKPTRTLVGSLQTDSMSELKRWLELPPLGFPGGAVVKNLPANAGHTGSSPGPGRSHMPRSK